MRVLELFSGTKSIGKVCDQLCWSSVSVDMILPADHNCDIMNFDYKQYPKDYFDIVFGSPPCTAYSNLQSCWLGRKKKKGGIYTQEKMDAEMNDADRIVQKAQEIIEYFNPQWWFIENPQTGKLKKREIMKDIPFYDVSYCMYSDWGYEKKTRIWTNKKDWNNQLCDKSGACGNMIDSQHKSVLGNGYEMVDGKKVLCNTKALRKKHRLNVSKDVHTVGEQFEKEKIRMKHKSTCDGGYDKRKKKVEGQINAGTTQLDRYRIPEDLILSLFLE